MPHTQNARERVHATDARRARHALHASPRHRHRGGQGSSLRHAVAALTRAEWVAVAWVPLLAAVIVVLCEFQVKGWTL